MPRLHTKQELMSLAVAVSNSMTLVTYKGHVYEARDYETGEASPSPERAIWLVLPSDTIMDIAQTLDILFANPGEFESFKYMIRQGSKRVKIASPHVMIRHEDGLAYLTDHGLEEVTADDTFDPNFINHRIIDKDDPDHIYVIELFQTITDWVGSERQAHSLLYHLATALQPGWSAAKYIILLGKGRNGKGTLLKMIRALLGASNVSGVLRQDIAARKSIIHALNGKLANIVFDGPKKYIAESGPEKTLTVGEPLDIEMKYENDPLTVETNALFMEALNKEPKAGDKSEALQARLVRFNFPNKYVKDLNFERYMLGDRMLDALLTLLWEHWVSEDELDTKLKITEESHDLQILSELVGSPILTFVEDISRKDPTLIEQLQSGSYPADALVDALQPWMQSQGYESRSASAIWELMTDHFTIERVVKREGGRPVTKRIIAAVHSDTLRALQTMGGTTDDDEAVVRGE